MRWNKITHRFESQGIFEWSEAMALTLKLVWETGDPNTARIIYNRAPEPAATAMMV